MVEKIEKKAGRPKKKGQKCNKVIYVREWTYYQLKNLIKGKETYDSLITSMISDRKKKEAQNENI